MFHIEQLYVLLIRSTGGKFRQRLEGVPDQQYGDLVAVTLPGCRNGSLRKS